MHYNKKKKKAWPFVLAGILVLALAGAAVWFFLLRDGGQAPAAPGSSGPPAQTVPPPAAGGSESGSLASTSTPPSQPPAGQNGYQAMPLPEEMRAMWLSYLEFRDADIATEAAMRSFAGEVFGNCAALGMNTVIVAVRPYSDALYKSSVYPWSDLLTGTQGQDPGYDPLAVLVEEAHARGLRIEAWFNPYRVRVNGEIPGALAADNPAVANPGWATQVGAEMWYDPGLPEVQAMVIAGAKEIVQNYEVDGICIDDYFYPNFTSQEANDAFDAATFAGYGEGRPKAEWRRGNVDVLVRAIYEEIKGVNSTVAFGISPQGNNENNYNNQYSDVKQWLATPGFADYIMPQLYWGFDYRTQGGRADAAFENKTAEWAAYPRHQSVRLYAALGAYRVGAGDGGANDQAEWYTGSNLARQAEYLRGVEGFSGFSLFRYHFLYNGTDLAAQEAAALAGLLA